MRSIGRQEGNRTVKVNFLYNNFRFRSCADVNIVSEDDYTTFQGTDMLCFLYFAKYRVKTQWKR